MDSLPVGALLYLTRKSLATSQERMGMLIKEQDIDLVDKIAKRERAPMYVVGETTGDMNFVFEKKNGNKPIDLRLEYMIGNPPRTVIKDSTTKDSFTSPKTDAKQINTYIEQVLQMESVACKDWLTNKVDRSITGKVARQQCAGELQLPLNDLGVVALDYTGTSGITTSIGHAPMAGLADPKQVLYFLLQKL